MFESRKNLNSLTVEALKTFCSTINPTGKAFHSTFLLQTIEKNEKKRGKCARFFNRPSALNMMVKWSYERATAKHLKENPSGPFPKQITFKDFSGRQYFTLQYRTTIGTVIQIEIEYPGYTGSSRLVVFGKSKYQVSMYAQLAGLPKPTWVPLTIPVLNTAMFQNEREIPLEQMVNVRIPLGELLDLLQKYAR